ncbi:NAD(+) synthase [Owenweeksia hongkongensis]|uniref:NAD(+) synthase n=1 Tax=Owenweeksia hongkongensis TaxID=253245 RepID=UPI003A8D7856
MNVQKVEAHIVSWLKDYIQKSGTKGFVVGVSGGIDSAITSALVARTGFPVLCVEMPIHQSPEQVNRAISHIKDLEEKYFNVSFQSVNLTGVFDNFIKAMPVVNDSEQRNLSLVNSRARLRMTTLYYFAGLYSYLVAGTGNKVEDFGVGFYTKYGDGGVDLSPIADLTKTEVYKLARHLGVRSDILQAPPTDGLWGDDRTDEDQIGASYPELEWAMEKYTEGKVVGDFEGRKLEVFQIYSNLHRANQHKMLPIPVCIIPPDYKN